MVDKQEIEYLIPIKLGSNQKLLHVLIDTGSSDLWVPSQDSDSFELPQKDFFDCYQSETCHRKNKRVALQYDDGPIEGWISTD